MTTERRVGSVIRVFGSVGVDGDEGPISIGGPKQRLLLALLAARSGSIVTIDWLAEYLWLDDERPEATAPAIRTYLSRLRQALPAATQDWIKTVPSGYRLDAPAEAVEHLRFRALRAEARRAREIGDPLTAHTKLDEALALWRGDPFREIEEFDWARADIEQLGVDRLEMFEERWEAALDLGRHTQITGELAAFTAEHNHRDRATQQYALALHRSGRTAEALRSIGDFRRRLADGSGLDPSPSMVELEQAMLEGDPSLSIEKLGRPLRGYRLFEEIGSGAFSVVWRGEQPSVQREVALKQIRSELASQPEFIRRFEAEAHLVARLEHPHIVPLIDFWRDPDSAYLVMRWLRGGTLERRLDDGALTLDETLLLARQIGGALSTAHAHGIVHRDVKTANILFDEQNNAFLGDFGIALEAAESAGPEAALSPGSPLYAAPEQIRRERLGPEADVFSLGVVLFECLTGSLPFTNAASPEQLVEHQLHTEYPTLAELRADVPPHISDAVAKATAKEPSSRYASIGEFIDALEAPADTTSPFSNNTPGDTTLTVQQDLENPYLGLQAFDDGDHDRFFGRDRLVTELVSRLTGNSVASRSLVVVGPSGSGKSSVVRAGLLPALRAGAVSGSSNWFSTTMVPGDDPYEALEVALLRIAVNPPPSLLEQLRDGPRGILRTVRRCLATDADTLVLLLDQFEEVFHGRAAADAHDFLDALAVAVDDPASPLRLVATLRADFYHRPLQHPTFARVLTAAAVDVAPLAADELERAIVEPAAQLGIGFEPGLVARIAAEAVGQPSPLPLLQHTLRELFERRAAGESTLTAEAYDELGGLSGALAARAESVYELADEHQRTAMRTVFGHLTDPTGASADLRRRAFVADLGDDPAVGWVVGQFASARLLTLDRNAATREPTVEVAHEALLREWPRLASWLDEDRDLLRTTRSISIAAAAWLDGRRSDTDLYRGDRLRAALDLLFDDPDRLRPVDTEFLHASRLAEAASLDADRRRVRRLRQLVAGTAVALVLALIAGGIAFDQQRRAQTEADAAVAAATDAELATIISRSAALGRDDPDAALLLALEAQRRSPSAETEQAVLNALGSTPSSNRLASFPSLLGPSCDRLTVDSDGHIATSTVDGVLVSRDLLSGQLTEHGPSPAECVQWHGDQQLDRRLANSEGSRIWVGPFDGQFDAERDFDAPTFQILSSFRSTGRVPVVSLTQGQPEILLLDDRTLATIGDPITGGDEWTSVEVNDAGSLVALGFATPNGLGGDGTLVVVDGVTADEQLRLTIPIPAAKLAFDEFGTQLLAATFEGRLLTIDLESGELLSDVALTTTGQVHDLEIGADGLVTVVSAGQLEVLDRFTGPVNEPVELRTVTAARIRPDGMILSIEASGATSVVTLDGNSLVDRSLEVDPFAQITMRDRQAGTSDSGTNPPELVDLATGERRVLEFALPGGATYDPYVVVPDGQALWTLGPDRAVSRWTNGEVAASVVLPGEPVGGELFADRWALITLDGNGEPTTQTVVLDPDDPRIELSLDIANAVATIPALGGGVHVVDSDGTMFTFDSSGTQVGEVATGLEGALALSVDPASGRVALASSDAGVAVIDPVTQEIQRPSLTEAVVSLGFARNGQYLALTSQDGTVRLWDVDRQVSAGLVWDGDGARVLTNPWYDDASDSIWIVTSGLLIEVPLDPLVWVERACDVVGRDFTDEEWSRLVPGDEPRQSACS